MTRADRLRKRRKRDAANRRKRGAERKRQNIERQSAWSLVQSKYVDRVLENKTLNEAKRAASPGHLMN